MKALLVATFGDWLVPPGARGWRTTLQEIWENGQQQDQGRLSYRLRFGDFGDAYPRERPMSSELFDTFSIFDRK